MTPLQWKSSDDASSLSSSPGMTGGARGFIIGLFGGAAFSMLVVGVVAGFALAGGLNGGSLFVGPSAQPADPLPTAGNSDPSPPAPPAEPVAPVTNDDHIRGNLDKAKVAVIEYSDFECPFCKRHHPTMKQITETYGDDVVWIYRHFPLSFHPNAQKAAEASECANELGDNDAFWKFADGVFALDALSNDAFLTVAKNIGLNEAKFKDCLASGKHAQKVQDQMNEGVAAGVQGTPGNFVVNLETKEQKEVSGAVPFATFKSAIDAMLGSEAQAAAPSGAARTIKMTAELWKFAPNVVRAKQGEDITLEITSVSGNHGFSVPELGINETIIQGKTVSVTIPTDNIGTFSFRCSIQCGSGHSDMTGQIIVEA